MRLASRKKPVREVGENLKSTVAAGTNQQKTRAQVHESLLPSQKNRLTDQTRCETHRCHAHGGGRTAQKTTLGVLITKKEKKKGML